MRSRPSHQGSGPATRRACREPQISVVLGVTHQSGNQVLGNILALAPIVPVNSVAWTDDDDTFPSCAWNRRGCRDIESGPLAHLQSQCHKMNTLDVCSFAQREERMDRAPDNDYSTRTNLPVQ
jgi:hypothetical protein